MLKNRVFVSGLLGIIIGLIASPIFPCQTFTLKKGNALIVGHNLGNRGHVPGVVVINKRGVRKKAVSWQEILSGDPAPNPPLEWTSKYGSVTFSPFCRDFADGGMNEAGLFIAEMTLDGTRFPEDDSRPVLFMMLWMQYVLDNLETVEQVIRSLNDLTIDGWTWHFFTADRQGNSAVIEFPDGDMKVYAGESLPYPILANTKYAEEVANLKNYQGFGGERPILMNNQKLQRFVHGARMIEDFDPEKHDAVDYGFRILHQFDRGGTQWSYVCDLKNLKAYFRSRGSRTIKALDLKDFDLSCGGPVKMIDYHSELEGDVADSFSDYSLERNRSFVDAAIRELPQGFKDFLTSLGSSVEEVLARIAGYSETTSCQK